ncbi:ABC transporter ATP-binding protein [Egibacter rhizosphaerae]|uniref:ABC transporter ATP-binding protein n=1 Tax=Egibacter rhizosphaerae TaxID=1670831 RepID=A0A411YG30_9ACTN|nr:ABC transporter ATP-binding protein [Egibacter rhizosphaerae]QBI20173.1 ABC transporter ATP-binding protein [Egibacter rhizosphaerae]
MSEVVAALEGVTKDYGPTRALDGVDLAVHRGEVLGLLGPNGSGKTTAVSLLAGLRRPDGGRVRLAGGDPRDRRTRTRLGVTAQQTGMVDVLKVRELAKWAATHYPAARDVDELLAEFGLDDLADKQFGGLSGGQQRRLTVALAFVGDPEVALLDEPTTGLDVGARRSLWDAIRRYGSGRRAVVLTSHYLEEVEALADRVVVLGRGRVLAEGTVDEIRRLVGLTKVRVRVAEDVEFATLGPVAQVERRDESVEVLTPDADQLVRGLVRHEIGFSHLEVAPASLEDAFLALTDDHHGAEGPAADRAAMESVLEVGAPAATDRPDTTTQSPDAQPRR